MCVAWRRGRGLGTEGVTPALVSSGERGGHLVLVGEDDERGEARPRACPSVAEELARIPLELGGDRAPELGSRARGLVLGRRIGPPEGGTVAATKPRGAALREHEPAK